MSQIDVIDTIADEFRAAWKRALADSSPRPVLEDVLESSVRDHGVGLREMLLAALLEVEVHRRSKVGESVTREELWERFPQDGPLVDQVFSQSTESTSLSQIPAVLPNLKGYELLGVLGKGGMGVVYKARDEKLKRLVAIKMIRAGAHAGADELARFRKEGEAIAKLEHPNIVQVYELEEHDGQPFIAMEFVTGGSLNQKINGTPLPPRDAGLLVGILAQAIQAAHDRGVIHRDLKPANVLLTSKGIPKITDFGLAKILEDKSSPTQSGDVFGTPGYSSPEQAGGRSAEIGPATDIYSLGAIFYELLTGRAPFNAATPLETLRLVIDTELVAPRQLNPAIDLDAETICLKSLSKFPAQRYGTARELAEDIQRWMQGESIAARRAGRIERFIKLCRRNLVVSSLIATAVLLLVGVAIVSIVSAVWLNALAEQRKSAIATSNANERKAADEASRANREADTALRQEKLTKRHLYVAHMNLAQVAWESAHVDQTVRLLDLYQPVVDQTDGSDDLLGFEWFYWYRCCHGERLALTGHTNIVRSVAFSWDGRQLASASADHTVKVWDAATGQVLLTLKGHTAPVTSVAFSRGGKRLASASDDHTVKVWDAATGMESLTLKGHTGYVWCVAFSHDGQRLASASWDQTIKVWDAVTGDESLTLKGHTGPVTSVAFSPKDDRLASACYDETIKLWDTTAGDEIRTLNGHAEVVSCVAFSPDGKQLASASFDRTLKVWDVATGQETLTLSGHKELVFAVAFSPDGQRLASAGLDKMVKVWDAASGSESLALKGHTGNVTSVAFSPNGKRLATGSVDQMVKVWDTAKGQESLTLKGHTSLVESVAFSIDGKWLASASYDRTVKVWDTATGHESHTLKGHTNFVESVAFSPDGKWLASASHDRTVKVWDATTGRESLTLKGHSDVVESVVFSPDGKRLASASQDQTVKVWDAATGVELFTLKGHTGFVESVAFSPDGKRLASASRDQTIKVWNASTGVESLTLKGHTGFVESVAFSPDGKQLASASWDQTIKVWDGDTGRELLALKGHAEKVTSVAFGRDGKRLASASIDQTIKVWDTATGQESLTLKGHTNAVICVAFDRDGQRLASASQDHTVKVWDATPRGERSGNLSDADKQ